MMNRNVNTRARYLWDYFGADAQQTAEHFKVHLVDFLERESILGCVLGVDTESEGHWACWCEADEELESKIVAGLLPKRKLPEGG